SWSRVGPPGPCRLPERLPPRRCGDMSLTDVLLFCRDSPDRARFLFTVRAAISSARSSLVPFFFAPDLMCSYCRSRFLDHACCGIAYLPGSCPDQLRRRRRSPKLELSTPGELSTAAVAHGRSDWARRAG